MLTAIVTGATGSIGGAIVSRLYQSGYNVCALGTDPDRLTALARCRIHPCHVDLSDEHAIMRWVYEFADQPADVLVHGAGVIRLNGIPNASLEAFDRQYRVNVRAPFQLTKLLLPHLTAARGQVVFLNSTVGLRASANGSQYGASKHALRALADSLRDEVNGLGIRVLSVYLGRTASAMQEAVCRSEGKPYCPASLIQPEDVAQMVTAALALPYTAEVTDLSIRPMRKH